jgi:serine/threonine protein kinase
MINENNLLIKLIDFDIAQHVISGELSTFYGGTLRFMSPQVREVSQLRQYSLEKNQVWQLGCILYKLYFLTNRFKYHYEKAKKGSKDVAQEMTDIYLMKYGRNGQKLHVMQFLAKMFAITEIERPTIYQVSIFNF